MPSIAFFTNHYWASDRRAGFHALAQAFVDAGWSVRFVTTGLSRLSSLTADPRLGQLRGAPRNRWIEGSDGVGVYVHCPPVHPFSRRPYTDWLTDELFARLYRRSLPERFWQGVEGCDVLVFESSAALLHVDEARRRAPRARMVYRVSDDVRVVGMARSIVAAEDAAIGAFDLVSVPSRILLARQFAQLGNALHQPHGLDLPSLEAARAAPWPGLAPPACVALGTTLFDERLLALCARARPDVRFHIVGAVPPRRRLDLPNIVWCGERPFEEALRMAAACDVAAAFYREEEGSDYLAETSNKIAQYTYLGKPIVGPAHLAHALAGCGFVPVDPATEAGAASAMEKALGLEAPAPRAGTFRNWGAVRDEMLAAIEPLPGTDAKHRNSNDPA